MILDIDGKNIEVIDGASFYSMFTEIWVEQIYKLKNMPSKPFFIDCGSNIGLAAIYLKTQFPSSEVVCFEPDQEIFKTLKKNVEVNFNLPGVKLFNYGLWKEDGKLEFFSEGADGGRIKTSGDSEKIISINVTKLSKYIDRTVDFLKIDIEGAEFEVLKEIESKLVHVRNMFIEYHSFAGREQMLPELMTILKNAGFKMNVVSIGPFYKTPMFHSEVSFGMDMQLNIFCTREN